MKQTEIKSLRGEIAGASEAELLAKRLSFKQELVNLSLQVATSQIQNTARITAVRKAIARIETALTAKRQAAAE
jgi:large subunit ribosomal protein L29